MTQKDVAIKYKDHELFGLIMTSFTGKEPDYKKFWVKTYRNSYNLATIYSNFKIDSE